MPKGVGYAKGSEYKGTTVHKKEPKPDHSGGGDSWGSPSSTGVPRSHEHPSPSDFSKARTPHKMGSGPMKMQGAPMNPKSEDSMPHKKTKGVR